MSFDQVTYQRGDLLWLLLIVPVLAALQLATVVARRRALAAFGGRGAGLVSRSFVLQQAKALLLLAAAMALPIALAGPQLGLTERAVRQQGADLVIALDVSQSMGVRDVQPDRLRVARDAIESLGRQLVGSRIALVLFAGDGVLRYPATSDGAVLGQVLDNSGRGFRLPGGSSLRAGIDAALSAFPDRRESQRKEALLVISDGEDPSEDPAVAAAQLRQRGIRVFAFGIGTQEGGQIPTYDADGRRTGVLRGADGQPITSRMHEETLRVLAEQGGGRYWHHTGEASAVWDLITEIRAMDTSEISRERFPDDRFQIFTALALAALLLDWLISDRRAMPTPRPAVPA